MNKKVYWSLRLVFGGFGIYLLFIFVPHLLGALKLLIPLYEMVDRSPEFMLMILCLSIWINCVVINTIVNMFFKLHSMLEDKLIKKDNNGDDKVKMDKIKELEKSLYNLDKVENRRKLKYAERVWIERTPKINALNYIGYRYFTNDFINFILSEKFKKNYLKLKKKNRIKNKRGDDK